MWFNKNAGDPKKWTVDFDLNRPVFTDRRDKHYTGRLTWQATPRNKFNFTNAEQCGIGSKTGGGSVMRSWGAVRSET